MSQPEYNLIGVGFLKIGLAFCLFMEFHYTPKERLASAIGVLGLCVSTRDRHGLEPWVAFTLV